MPVRPHANVDCQKVTWGRVAFLLLDRPKHVPHLQTVECARCGVREAAITGATQGAQRCDSRPRRLTLRLCWRRGCQPRWQPASRMRRPTRKFIISPRALSLTQEPKSHLGSAGVLHHQDHCNHQGEILALSTSYCQTGWKCMARTHAGCIKQKHTAAERLLAPNCCQLQAGEIAVRRNSGV